MLADIATDWRGRIIGALGQHAGAAEPTASDDADGKAPAAAIIPAAVLVPIVLHPEPTLLLTLRTASLAAHAGQVSFPGGRIEHADANPAAAALRETFEETGIAPDQVELAGPLPRHLTGTGYAIAPVVGLLRPPLACVPSAHEVAELFELPLAVLLDPEAPRREAAMFRGRMRSYWVIPHERHFIWGATAAILVNLGRVLRAARM